MSDTIERKFVVETFSKMRNAGLRVYEGNTPLGKSVHIECFWPSSLSADKDTRIIIDKLYGSNRSEANRNYAFVGLMNPVISEVFLEFSHPGLLLRLGYSYKENTETNDNRTTKTVDFEYPSVETLNEVLSSTFPNQPMKFITYPGGIFPQMDFMRAYIKRGEIMIGSNYPYVYHDHVALHVLGYIGLGGLFMDYMREQLTPILDHVQKETDLPKIPNMSDQVAEFFQPSARFLKAVMRNLDRYTGLIAADLLIEDNRGIRSTLSSFFSPGDRDGGIPSSILHHPSNSQLERIACDIRQRYRDLGADLPDPVSPFYF